MTVYINGTTGYSGPVGTIGDLTTTGNTTLGDASGDTLTLNGNTASIPNNLNFTNGNIGIGVTPSTWSGFTALDMRGALSFVSWNSYSTGGTYQNVYYDGAFRYKSSTFASRFLANEGNVGGFQWQIAPSGTAGNAITFTQALTLDASGNLGLGVTPNVWLSNRRVLQIGGNTVAAVSHSATIGESIYNLYYNSGGSTLYQNTGPAAVVDFNNRAVGGFSWNIAASGTAGNAVTLTQAMTLTSSGFLGIGTTSPDVRLRITGSNVPSKGLLMLDGSDYSQLSFYSGSTRYAQVYTSVADGYFYINAVNALSIGTSDTTRININAAGQITYANQPRFFAYGASGSSGTNGAYWIFPNTTVNTGGHYSTSTGIFTVPVAGVYRFFWSNIGNNVADIYRYFIYVDNAQILGGLQLRLDTSGTKYGDNGAAQVILSLTAGQTVRIFFSSDGSNSSYSGQAYPYFGGELIG